MTKRQNPSLGEGLIEKTARRNVPTVISDPLPEINIENAIATIDVAVFGVTVFLIATMFVAVAGVMI